MSASDRNMFCCKPFFLCSAQAYFLFCKKQLFFDDMTDDIFLAHGVQFVFLLNSDVHVVLEVERRGE